MALRNAVMAALLEGEASGYDLARSFDASVADFWMATPQQLYRELERMATEGLVQARMVEQEKRPNKRLFSLTDTGRRALYAFTAAPPRPGAMREELMVQVQAADVGDTGAVREAVAERMAWARGKIARYERLRDRLLDGRSEEDHLARAERVGPYLTLMRGLEFERENLRWGERVLDVLSRRTPSRADAEQG
ncbi:PadR family transcriptional regulator [Streptomonospora wellingtoniae]|uniref:PadR family transcriptional regulator n=1 Tax=Streptomonospora wellingtoniae TaxID=3075544 RepID=A0ABU2L0T8_9ACTN|nr:PadR family transcriptional regulator [Streptomonospora sp. DSM 45055]MDT0305169.1 PadR family transcriptional regulator [Streptomonospora sp. DSM 45055]